jgi:hypothetical protein
MPTLEEVYNSAWDDFSKWCREHDPDGERSCLEQAEAYGRWIDGARGEAVWRSCHDGSQ